MGELERIRKEDGTKVSHIGQLKEEIERNCVQHESYTRDLKQLTMENQNMKVKIESLENTLIAEKSKINNLQAEVDRLREREKYIEESLDIIIGLFIERDFTGRSESILPNSGRDSGRLQIQNRSSCQIGSRLRQIESLTRELIKTNKFLEEELQKKDTSLKAELVKYEAEKHNFERIIDAERKNLETEFRDCILKKEEEMREEYNKCLHAALIEKERDLKLSQNPQLSIHILGHVREMETCWINLRKELEKMKNEDSMIQSPRQDYDKPKSPVVNEICKLSLQENDSPRYR